MEFDYLVHLYTFVGQQAAFGEHLRGDTLQERDLGRYRHLQREAVIHDSVGLDDAVAEHEALCFIALEISDMMNEGGLFNLYSFWQGGFGLLSTVIMALKFCHVFTSSMTDSNLIWHALVGLQTSIASTNLNVTMTRSLWKDN